ncbi:restriction endonuclease subunit S [Paraburkholderia sp. RL18-103-BIB-C]|uniref:restriction endonuclease subunit S n=1 Tax=Paraburkholderia sp. RL18-103-BIB-C TaxID=3031637 RepID=UPI0038BD0CA9
MEHNSILPNGWCLTTLQEIASWGSGGTPSRAVPRYFAGTIPWIKTGELGEKYIRCSEEKISEEALNNSSAKIFPKNSVGIAMYGATIGKLSIWGIDASTNQACAVGVPSEAVDKEYLYYFLLSERETLIKAGKGGAQPNISQGIIKEWPIALTPLREQHRIVAKIEELFSELDKGIESLKTAQAQLKVYRQALLKHAFEGKLTAQWRADNPDKLGPADVVLKRIQLERAQRYQQQLANWEASGKQGGKPKAPKLLTPLTAEELDQLPNLPTGWRWEKNENYLFEVKDGTHDTPSYLNSGIPFVTQKNIRDGRLNMEDVAFISSEDHTKFYKRSNVQQGDIIISMIGHGRGQCCIVKSDVVFSIKNVGLFKFFHEFQSNEFLCFYYQSTGGLNLALSKSKGGAQPFIGLTELRNWPVPVCSHQEQRQIVEELAAKFSEIEQLEQTINTSRQQAEALRRSILKKAFSGQLVPQDPHDEPASALLARIKAGKSVQHQGKKTRK